MGGTGVVEKCKEVRFFLRRQPPSARQLELAEGAHSPGNNPTFTVLTSNWRRGSEFFSPPNPILLGRAW